MGSLRLNSVPNAARVASCEPPRRRPFEVRSTYCNSYVDTYSYVLVKCCTFLPSIVPFLSTYFWTKPHHTTILDSQVVLALPTVWLFKWSHFAIYSIHNTISLGHFSLMSWDSVNEGGLLKDLELRRVTINSHIFRVIDVLLVNKSYCALGHTWYGIIIGDEEIVMMNY